MDMGDFVVIINAEKVKLTVKSQRASLILGILVSLVAQELLLSNL